MAGRASTRPLSSYRGFGPATRRLWILSLVTAIVLGSTPAHGRGIAGTLAGIVRDKDSHAPLIAVNVLIVGTNLGAITDENGRFQIQNVRAGVYDVRFTMVGYGKLVMKRVTILPDLRTDLTVDLEVSSVELDAVEVRAERPLIQRDQAATAFSLGEQKLETLPISRFEETLTLQPGVTREGNVRGGRVSEVVYLVDGLPVQDVVAGGLGAGLPKSAITGMTIWTGGFDAEYGNALSGVVNVVTKSGNNTPELDLRYELDQLLPESISQQTDRAQEFELTAGGPIQKDRWFYFTSNVYSVSDTRWWQDMQHFFSSPIRRELSGIGKIEYLPSPTLRLSLQGIYSFQRWRDYEFSWRYDLAGLPRRSIDSYRAALQVSNTISSSTYFTLSADLFFNRNRIGDDRPTTGLTPYQYDFYLRYIVSGARNWWADVRQLVGTVKGDITSEQFGNHLFKAGFEFHQYHIQSDVQKFEPQTTYFGKPLNDAPLLDYSNAYAYRPRSGDLFVQDKIQVVADGSILTFGLRWDFLDPTADRPIVEFIPITPGEYEQQVTGRVRARLKQQVSPRISFAGPFGPSSFIFVNYGQYFQFPLFEFLYQGTNPAQLRYGAKNVLAGNPDLDPERLIAWEIGVKHLVRPDVVASVTFFQKQIENQIDAKTLVPFDSKFAGDYGFASYVNNAEASASGLEFVLSRERTNGTYGTLSYTYMVAEGVSEYADQTINRAQWGFPLFPAPYPLSWDQRHTVKLDVTARLFWQMDANLLLQYSSPRPYTYYPTRDGFVPADTSQWFSPNNRRMTSVTTVDVKLSRSFGAWGPLTDAGIYLDIRNLLNQKNVRWMDSNGRIGGELGDPSAYYDLRRVRVGIRCGL